MARLIMSAGVFAVILLVFPADSNAFAAPQVVDLEEIQFLIDASRRAEAESASRDLLAEVQARHGESS